MSGFVDQNKERWPESWEAIGKTGNLLPRSNAFKALMTYLKEDIYLELVGESIGRVPKTGEFFVFFKDLKVRDEDFTSRNFVPGSGGQSTFLKLLRGDITMDDITES